MKNSSHPFFFPFTHVFCILSPNCSSFEKKDKTKTNKQNKHTSWMFGAANRKQRDHVLIDRK